MVIDHLLFRLTVDGSEIRREPVEVGLSHYLQGFTHPRWCRISEPSTVVVFKSNFDFFPNAFVKIEDGSMDDWDDEGFSMPFSEEDDGPPAEGAIDHWGRSRWKRSKNLAGEHGSDSSDVTKLG